MADNPYSGLLGIMREQGAKDNPKTICIGTIIEPDPLTIKTEDLTLYHDDLYVSDILLGEYKRNVIEKHNGNTSMTGQLSSSTQSKSGGSGEASYASHNHTIENAADFKGTFESDGEGEIILQPYLKTGDLLAMMPTGNGQKYIVLCKVVEV